MLEAPIPFSWVRMRGENSITFGCCLLWIPVLFALTRWKNALARAVPDAGVRYRRNAKGGNLLATGAAAAISRADLAAAAVGEDASSRGPARSRLIPEAVGNASWPEMRNAPAFPRCAACENRRQLSDSRLQQAAFFTHGAAGAGATVPLTALTLGPRPIAVVPIVVVAARE